MVKMILTVLLALGMATPDAWGKKDDEAPELRVWLEEWSENGRGEDDAYPHVLAFVSELPERLKDSPKLLDIDADAFNALGFFQTIDSTNAEWDFKLNRRRLSELDALEAVQELTGADTVVLAPSDDEWQLLRFEKGKRTTLHTAKAPKSLKPKDLMAWIPAILHWDGVVIERRGDFLLVGSTAAILSSLEIQALAVGDSAKRFALTKTQREGAGLLSLSETKGGVGIFDIVFLGQGVRSLPAGTKILIERRGKKAVEP